MVRLELVEENESTLVYKMGVWATLCHMSLCTLIVAVVSISLTMFLRHYLGIFAFVLIAMPGLCCVICGFFGCANARQFKFTFDKTQGSFCALAGGARIVKALNEIRLIYIERECSGGGAFGGDAPSFAATVLFSDGQRCRLEGGVSITGAGGKGPEHLQVEADRIRQFLNLPQTNLPLLNVSRASKDERPADPQQGEVWLSRWLACQGIIPRLEPPLTNFDWVEPPEGPVRLPGGQYAGMEMGMGMQGGGGMVGAQQQRWARPIDPGLGPVVMGRPQPQMSQPPVVRQIQVVVPQGAVGTTMVVMAPDGSQLSVPVPSDMQPGQTMAVQY